jgi:ankyrin repeat protein
LEILLEKEEIDVNALNGLTHTPLMKIMNGISKESLLVSEMLLKHGASTKKEEYQKLNEIGFNVPDSNRKPIAARPNPLSKLFNSIVSQNMEDCCSEIEYEEAKHIYSRYIGTKSVLHHMIVVLDSTKLKNLLQSGVNPWIRNVDDGKLALHRALARGSSETVQILLKHMNINRKSVHNDLKSDTFSLLQAVLCNAPTVEANDKTSTADYLKCLDVLLISGAELNMKQTSPDGDRDLEQLLSWLNNVAMKRLVAEKTNLKVTPEEVTEDGK